VRKLDGHVCAFASRPPPRQRLPQRLPGHRRVLHGQGRRPGAAAGRPRVGGSPCQRRAGLQNTSVLSVSAWTHTAALLPAGADTLLFAADFRRRPQFPSWT
jgi:hypothetical protein